MTALASALTQRRATGFDGVLHSRDLMTHDIEVRDVPDRRRWLAELCAGRSVLHVGCCDVPIFDPNNNLHIFLAEYARRLDGLDVSEEGIAVLRRHVEGDYFLDPSEVRRAYDLLLVPEVLEHTPNAGDFLAGIFSLRATRTLITAPDIRWYERMERRGDVFTERVHGDHKAWYSPYTLLNAIRPFVDGARDELEVFLLPKTGSVGVLVTRAIVADGAEEPALAAPLEPESALRQAAACVAEGRDAAALEILREAEARTHVPELRHEILRVLLDLGRTMDVLRRGIPWIAAAPRDTTLRAHCADAMERLGDHARARKLRGAIPESRKR